MSHFHRTMPALLGAAWLAMAQLSAQAQTQDSTPAPVTPPQNVQLQHQEIARGDPARWYQDDATPAAQMKTLRKEIGAALQEATLACKRQPASERAQCIKDARATYQQDMANAQQIRDEQHRVQ